MNILEEVNTFAHALVILLMWYGIYDALHGIKKEIRKLEKEIRELKDLIKKKYI